jgi:hypothetical protein
MDISTNNDWSRYWLQVVFLNKDLLDSLAKLSEFSLWKRIALLQTLEPLVNIRSLAHL